jgi:uncharacterized integral membrane protein
MRVLVAFVVGILAAGILATLGILVGQNSQTVSYTFMDAPMSAGLGALVGAAAILGFLLAFLLLVPGRLASAWRGLLLSRQTRQLEDRLAMLREQHAQLQGSHERLLEDHRQVIGKVLAPAAAASAHNGHAAPAPATRPVAVAIAEAPPPAAGDDSTAASPDNPASFADQARLRFQAVRDTLLRRDAAGQDDDADSTDGPAAPAM